MRLLKAKKYHKCKNHCDIWPSSYYYTQRRSKALCFKFGYKQKRKGFIAWLLGKLE